MQLTTLLVSIVLGAVSVSAAATTTFPSAAGATTLSAAKTVTGTFDGGMKRFGRGGEFSISHPSVFKDPFLIWCLLQFPALVKLKVVTRTLSSSSSLELS